MVDAKLGVIVVVALLVGSAVGVGVATVAIPDDSATASEEPTRNGNGNATADDAGVTTFGDASEFREYLRQGNSRTTGWGWYLTGTSFEMARPTVTFDDTVTRSVTEGPAQSEDATPSRHSSTNVQEVGIDEPDILKTTGDHVYYSSKSRYYRISPTIVDGDRPEWNRQTRTHVIDSGDPASPEAIAGINESGNLLLSGDSLVVFQRNRLVGYDVSDPANPERTWSRSINGTVETARLLNGSIYLVTRSGVSPGMACPIEPLSGPGGAIDCTDIYRPNRQIPADVTYTAFSLQPESGEVTDSVSAVGTTERSAVYVSESALYLTYTERTPRGEITIDAALSAETDVPDWVETRLREIRSYNLSSRATEIEAEATIRQWLDGLPAEERETVSEEFSDGVTAYVENNRRDLVTTGVVRVGLDEELSVEATGQVPGEPLNQFSMDEHNGSLRIATTVPRQFGTNSTNDLYTLESDTLDRQGSVTGMGTDQRVYAVRYVGETAYVVTFRQVDPFHVVDLSDPDDPEEVGELELPGYSSYLHPIDDNHVLGIGQEDGQVKAVLFNVSEPGDPTIEDTYYPEASWSAIDSSHHAFLIDRRHGVFFLPGGYSGGFVVDYTGGDLSLEKRVGIDGQARRAAYIDDYLYVFSDQELVVMDENDWSQANEVTLPSPDR